MYEVRLVVLVALMALIPITAVQADTWEDPDWVIESYWDQFNVNHTTQVPVVQWLAERGQEVLLEGEVNGVQLRMTWDVVHEAVLVEILEEGAYVLLDDVAMLSTNSGRPAWEAGLDQNGHARFGGTIDIDEVNALVVLGITVDGVAHKMFADELGGQPAPAITIAIASVCRCFGTGEITMECEQDDCDQGVSCGPSRSCRNCAARTTQLAEDASDEIDTDSLTEPDEPTSDVAADDLPDPDTSGTDG